MFEPSHCDFSPCTIRPLKKHRENKSRSRRIGQGTDDRFDPDVLNYVLTALMLHPTVDDGAVKQVESNLRLVHEQVEQENAGVQLPIVRYAATKLTMSLCRLNHASKMDETAFSLGRE